MIGRPLIVANWKMHGRHDWRKKPKALARLMSSEHLEKVDVVFCPPFPYITSIAKRAATYGFYTGGQTCHVKEAGAFTGDVSAPMLRDCGASYVIVGHSERRAKVETSAIVKTQAEAALECGLTPIICVGEPLKIREAGEALEYVETQIRGSLPQKHSKSSIVIAYEPIWAIGTGRIPKLEDIHNMHAQLRKLCGADVRLLYGGSVKAANAAEILNVEHVNGALVGGASLKMDSFSKIVQAAL